MKQVIMLILLFCAFSTVKAQSSNAPKVINLDNIAKAPKTQEQLAKNAKLTEYKAIYKTVSYPVYVTVNGKYFIIVKAQTSGNLYRKYIKLDE